VFTTRRYTNPRLPLPYLTFVAFASYHVLQPPLEDINVIAFANMYTSSVHSNEHDCVRFAFYRHAIVHSTDARHLFCSVKTVRDLPWR